MDKIQSIQKLLHDLFNFAQTEFDIGIGQQTGQIVLTEVKDQIKGGFEFVELSDFRPADFYQVDHIFVLEELEYSNFSQSSDWKLETP